MRCFAGILEAEGDGCKLTEVRMIDMAGSLMNAVINKATTNMPEKNFACWNKALA